MKKLYFLSIALAIHALCFAQSNLILTGVIDGPLPGGLPKAIELYVVADIPDLSIYGLGSANNGGGTDGQEFTFPAVTASAGDFIYVSSESTEFNNFFGFVPDYTSSSAGINGDDAIELFKNGTVIDVFGDIDTDGSGQAWDYLDGWAYRKDLTVAGGSTFTVDHWTYSGINALDGESTNATATTPFPTETYSPLTASVKENQITDFKMYPNPATNGSFSISSKDNFSKKVEIFSLVGQQVISTTIKNQENIDISHLIKGLYLVKIEENGKIASRKLVIN